MTVSRAMNYPDQLAPSTLRRVEEAIADTGFVPDRAARQLASTKCDRRGARFQNGIGLVYPAENKLELSPYVACALEAASRRGFRVFPIALNGSARSPLKSARAEGLLLLPGSLSLANLPDSGVPAVLIGDEGGPHPIASVFVDSEATGFEIAQRLLDANHKRIGFIGSPQTELHFNGVRRALSARGVALGTPLSLISQSEDATACWANGLFLRPADQWPTAIVACSVELGVACLTAAKARGLRIPEQLTIVVIDDQCGPTSGWPQLVRVPRPVSELCGEAVSMLVRQIGNPASGRRTSRLQPRLVRAITAEIPQLHNFFEQPAT